LSFLNEVNTINQCLDELEKFFQQRETEIACLKQQLEAEQSWQSKSKQQKSVT
jgi:hypothetical protein